MSNVPRSVFSVPEIMGIINVTPDSFFDGGVCFDGGSAGIDAALRQAEQMVADGAAFIDIGGESTRPGALPISTQQELDRVIPVVLRVRENLDVKISVDTGSPQVILEAASAGANLINDVRALQREGAIDAAKKAGLDVCLMHMQGEPSTMQQAPHYNNVVAVVRDFFTGRVDAVTAAGISTEKIYLDPGFGFGKTLEHNLQLFAQLDTLSIDGLPLLIGYSRKSMIGNILGVDSRQRLYGGLALAALATQKGVRCIRTHDVLATSDVVRMTNAVLSCQTR